jgi:hypothetical protein
MLYAVKIDREMAALDEIALWLQILNLRSRDLQSRDWIRSSKVSS